MGKLKWEKRKQEKKNHQVFHNKYKQNRQDLYGALSANYLIWLMAFIISLFALGLIVTLLLVSTSNLRSIGKEIMISAILGGIWGVIFSLIVQNMSKIIPKKFEELPHTFRLMFKTLLVILLLLILYTTVIILS